MIYDIWYAILDMWYMICDVRHMMYDTPVRSARYSIVHMHPTSSQREKNSDGFKMLSHELSHIPFHLTKPPVSSAGYNIVHKHPTSPQREMNSDGFKMLSLEFSYIPSTSPSHQLVQQVAI